MKHKSNNQVLTSANRSAGTGYSNIVNANSYEYAMIVLYITAKSGAPNISVNLQCSPIDPSVDSTKWRNASSVETITNAMIGTTYPKIFGTSRSADFSGWIRVAYTLAGSSTPKITFSMNIEIK